MPLEVDPRLEASSLLDRLHAARAETTGGVRAGSMKHEDGARVMVEGFSVALMVASSPRPSSAPSARKEQLEGRLALSLLDCTFFDCGCVGSLDDAAWPSRIVAGSR